MSLDLLQAFGDPSCEESANPWATSDTQGVNGAQPLEDDDFGDFELPESSDSPAQSTVHAKEQKASALSTNNPQGDLLIDTTTTRPPPSPSFQKANASLKLAIPLETDHVMPLDSKPEEPTPITAWPSYGRGRAKSLGKPLPLSPYADDDEWGDFEAETQVNNESIENAEREILGIHDPPKKPAVPNNSLLDLWETSEKQTAPAVRNIKPSDISSLEPAAPSNIPPPSVLLSVVANILQSLSAEIKDIVSSTSTALADRESLENDIVLDKLTTKVATIRASARITAGRRLRWKRDVYLAQSMRIGPSNAGKPGGMKLTGVDRTETRREDQEAAEVERLWKQQVGGLKSQIARINAQQSDIEFRLPDISENMPIRTAKVGEGALMAPKCCFLCGLKRDERVARLDVTVEDSFGEWWVDHWGHTDCMRFWGGAEASLKQR